MHIEDRHQATQYGAVLLDIDPEPLYSTDVPEIDGFFISQTFRGGVKLLIGRDGAVLFGTSRFAKEDLVERWIDGERSVIPEDALARAQSLSDGHR